MFFQIPLLYGVVVRDDCVFSALDLVKIVEETFLLPEVLLFKALPAIVSVRDVVILA